MLAGEKIGMWNNIAILKALQFLCQSLCSLTRELTRDPAQEQFPLGHSWLLGLLWRHLL